MKRLDRLFGARSARRTWRVGVALLFGCALALASGPVARAEGSESGGALTGHVLVADGDLGGLAMLDMWAAPSAWARVGGFFGGGATPSARDDHSRVFMPVGLSVAAELPLGEIVRLDLRLRAGFWGGATQSEKLTLGLFGGGGAYLAFLLGDGAALQVGADVWALIASDAFRDVSGPTDRVSASTWIVAPGVGLSWAVGSP